MSTYERVAKWNEKVNNKPAPIGTNAYYTNLQNQFLRIQEELNEVYEAIVNKDLTGIVDGGLDLDVVVAGFNYLSGAIYGLGINSILDNNDLKYHTDRNVVEQWKFFYDANGIETEIQESVVDDVTYFSLHRLEDNKVMKYGNFPKVDLSPVVPEPVSEQFILVTAESASGKSLASGIHVSYIHELGDETGVLKQIAAQHDNKDLLMTILNGDLVNVEVF